MEHGATVGWKDRRCSFPLHNGRQVDAREETIDFKGLESLVLVTDQAGVDDGWTTLINLVMVSGIKYHVLHSLRIHISNHIYSDGQHRNLLQILWENADVRFFFLFLQLKLTMFRFRFTKKLGRSLSLADQSIDKEDSDAIEYDEFGPTRTAVCCQGNEPRHINPPLDPR
jgi:hypothetical protein